MNSKLSSVRHKVRLAHTIRARGLPQYGVLPSPFLAWVHRRRCCSVALAMLSVGGRVVLESEGRGHGVDEQWRTTARRCTGGERVKKPSARRRCARGCSTSASHQSPRSTSATVRQRRQRQVRTATWTRPAPAAKLRSERNQARHEAPAAASSKDAMAAPGSRNADTRPQHVQCASEYVERRVGLPRSCFTWAAPRKTPIVSSHPENHAPLVLFQIIARVSETRPATNAGLP